MPSDHRRPWFSLGRDRQQKSKRQSWRQTWGQNKQQVQCFPLEIKCSDCTRRGRTCEYASEYDLVADGLWAYQHEGLIAENELDKVRIEGQDQTLEIDFCSPIACLRDRGKINDTLKRHIGDINPYESGTGGSVKTPNLLSLLRDLGLGGAVFALNPTTEPRRTPASFLFPSAGGF